MKEEYKSSEVIFKYHLPENRDDVYLHVRSYDMYRILSEIDDACRTVIKYEDESTKTRTDLAQQIRDIIHENFDMDMVK